MQVHVHAQGKTTYKTNRRALAKLSIGVRYLAVNTSNYYPQVFSRRPLFLFTAGIQSPKSAAMDDANIELSVTRRSQNVDLASEIVTNFEGLSGYYQRNGISQEITNKGTWTIDGVSFAYVDSESVSKSSHSWYRFVVRQVVTAQ